MSVQEEYFKEFLKQAGKIESEYSGIEAENDEKHFWADHEVWDSRTPGREMFSFFCSASEQ